MIRLGVSWNGITPIHFCDPGMKMTTKVYVTHVAERGLNVENVLFGKPYLTVWVHHMHLTNV